MLVQSATGEISEPVFRADKPNIIVILADDLGYGDLGAYGQTRIETPNIDRLAASGMLFTSHYSGSPVSAPSRCVLLTGRHSGHSQVRGNDEWASRGDVWNYKAMIADPTLEGQRPLAGGTVTMASLMKKTGYTTGMIGKWGLGAPNTESIPTKMGFDYFFGINCQRMAHTHYPLFLYENERRVWLDNDTVAPGTKLKPGDDINDPSAYSQFTLNEYAPELMFSRLQDFISKNREKPFFLYWATPVPHAALQAPERWVDHYRQKFGQEEPYTGDKGYFPHRNPRAAYAAMISHFDEQVGLLVGQLKELGLIGNTVIMLTSDNGPSYNGGTDSPWFKSAGPFRSEQGFAKGNVNEGGIRVPLIVSWPGYVRNGSTSDLQCAFWDILPTVCEISGSSIPQESDGISFLPELLGRSQRKHEFLYWEFPESGGQQAVILGKYKALRKNMHKGNMLFEVYDIEKDPEEKNNIAAAFPDIIKMAAEIAMREHSASTNERWKFKQLDN